MHISNVKLYRILCFGDSNTWGRSGSSVDRYPNDVRWTGILQHLLGEKFEVLEEGLRSRTTDLDDDDPKFPYRNGAAYLRPCLESHGPLDLVVLWLGTNDLKTKYHRTAEEVASAVEKLLHMINSVAPQAKILLVSPPLVREDVLKPHSQFMGAGEKSRQLAFHLEALAQKYECSFVDIAQYVTAGDADGVHLEPEMHPKIAKIFNQTISSQIVKQTK